MTLTNEATEILANRTDQEIIDSYGDFLSRRGLAYVRQVSPKAGFWIGQNFISDRVIIAHYRRMIKDKIKLDQESK